MIDREVLHKCLTELALGEGVSPENVWKTLKNPRHPLHDAIDWNESSAAYKYQLDQCRSLIRMEMEFQGSTYELEPRRTIEMFVHNPALPGNVQGYVSTNVLVDNRSQAIQAVLTEIQRVLSYLDRAHRIAGLVGVRADITSVTDQVKHIETNLRRRLVGAQERPQPIPTPPQPEASL